MLPAPGHVIVVGQTLSGKSHWVQFYLQRHWREMYDELVVFTGSAGLNDDWEWLPPSRVIDIAHLPRVAPRLLKLGEAAKRAGRRWRCGIVLDDFVSHLNTHGGVMGKLFDRIASQGRHRGISAWYLTQRYNKVSPTIRDNALAWVLMPRLPQGSVKEIGEHQSAYSSWRDFWEAYTRHSATEFAVTAITCDPAQPPVSFHPPAPATLPKVRVERYRPSPVVDEGGEVFEEEEEESGEEEGGWWD